MMVLGDVQDFTKQYYTQWFVKIINKLMFNILWVNREQQGIL